MIRAALIIWVFFLQQIAVASNEFSLNLYHQLTKEDDGNFVVSPYSIENILLMIAEGAQAETALEIGNVLGLNESQRVNDDNNPWLLDPIHEIVNQLNRSMRPSIQGQAGNQFYEVGERGTTKHNVRAPGYDSGVTTAFNVDNSIWSDETYPIKQSYIDKIGSYYGENAILSVDMINHPRETVEMINGWANEKTDGKIPHVVDAISDDERLVLVNTVYFKGEWEVPFNERKTASHEFTLEDGGVVSAQMMVNNDRFGSTIRYAAFNKDGSYFETPMYNTGDVPLYPDQDGFSIVELPYKESRFSMVIIAPNKHDRFRNLQKILLSSNLEKWLGKLRNRETTTYLPRFKMNKEYADLDDFLKSIGMVRAFDAQKAQFGKMTDAESAESPLYISQMIHKSFLEVNERGTEAAAASVARMQALSYVPPFKPTFKADKPFIFIIRDRASNVILFIGHYVSPS